MKKAWIFVVIALVLGGIWWATHNPGAAGKGGKRVGAKGAAVPPVTTARAVLKTMPRELKNFGAVDAFATVTIKPQVAGVLTNIQVKKGQWVKEGDVLFSIDARPYEAAVRKSEANLMRNRAQYENAAKEAKRQSDLLKKGIAAEETYDQALTTERMLEAAVMADQAALDADRLQWSYCQIVSPIEGRAGDILVDRGNVLKANESVLLTINQTRPIYVTFTAPQQALPEIRKQLALGPPPVEVSLSEDAPTVRGLLTFVDNTVDLATGSIKLKAEFENADERLWPGLFVRVKVDLSAQSNAVVIPSRALQIGQKGSYVFRVGAEGSVQDQVVTVDHAVGEESIIASGLAEGDEVVTDGQLRLAPGMKVQIKNGSAKDKAKEPLP